MVHVSNLSIDMRLWSGQRPKKQQPNIDRDNRKQITETCQNNRTINKIPL